MEEGREVGRLWLIRNLAALTLAFAMVACAQRANEPEGGDGGPSPAAQNPPDINAMINHFKASGLPIGRVDVYNADNDPFKRLGRPGEYVGKAVFQDSRFPLPPGGDFTQWAVWGGTIETFASSNDLESWKRRIRLARERDPTAPPEYQYEKGLALIRLGTVFTPEQARAYEAALASFPG